MHPAHREAQRQGRETYYETYSLQICEVKRESKFDRNARRQAAG
jgi:heme-degrading monooxygenase HmoA